MPASELVTLGWREWVALPEFGIDRIKAKVDTGARTSCLHAFYVEPFTTDGRDRVRFGVHPKQFDTDVAVDCEADVLDTRDVTDSGGHQERRIVIATTVVLCNRSQVIEITLTDRDTMRFRMLIGRTALKGHYLVDVAASFLGGLPDQWTETGT